MCGIVGVVHLDGRAADRALLEAMTAQLCHRGPDDEGYWIDGSVGLGHRRLAIIDVNGSLQPMSSSDGRLTMVFNGEIFNYKALRSGIRRPLRTSGDTEVLLALLQNHGQDAVTLLRGQFAFAAFDSADRSLMLFRDRLGVLPLYYYRDQNLFAFASEIKALLPALPHGPRVDEQSMVDYLAHRSVPAPDTLFAGIKKLPPGHGLRLHATGRVGLRAYWELPRHQSPDATADSDAVNAVHAALQGAVRDAMVADVPVGAYLSGGVDSSLITAMMVAEREGGPVETFSAGFDGLHGDELPWARRVSGLLGTRHHETRLGPDDFATLWAKLTWHRDAPISEPADVAVFRLAELARSSVKVILSGEGSDELFGGYPKHAFATLMPLARRVPHRVRGPLLEAVSARLPARLNRARIAVRALSESSDAEMMRAWFAPFSQPERHQLLRKAGRSGFADWVEQTSGSALFRMLVADARFWLPDNLLERGDRMSMAASVELRPPFLDDRLVSLAFTLPDRVKVRGLKRKWVVKAVARRYLPLDVVTRPKVGFRVPLDSWFRGSLRDMGWDLLTGSSSFVANVMDQRSVRELLLAHETARRNEEMRIWTLLSLEVWHQRFMRSAALPAATLPTH